MLPERGKRDAGGGGADNRGAGNRERLNRERSNREHSSSQAAVPNGFVGVDVDGPVYPATAPGVNLAAQFAQMERSGVESVRVVFSWAAAQRYGSWSQVPLADRSEYINEGGVPTDFSQIDEVVGLAAHYGLTVLPTVIYAPSWDITGSSSRSFGRPARDLPYALFLADLVRRYGPGGAFWRRQTRAAIPIREWQIWNEPNIPTYWPTQPFANSYVALLKVAATAIRAVDPSAEIVLAGMPNYSWLDLEHIYKVPGRAPRSTSSPFTRTRRARLASSRSSAMSARSWIATATPPSRWSPTRSVGRRRSASPST